MSRVDISSYEDVAEWDVDADPSARYGRRGNHWSESLAWRLKMDELLDERFVGPYTSVEQCAGGHFKETGVLCKGCGFGRKLWS